MISPWQRFGDNLFEDDILGLSLDISQMGFTEDWLLGMEPRMQEIYLRIHELESGALANPDEGRMVGHYWLRSPQLGPTPEIREDIRRAQLQAEDFARQVHNGTVGGRNGKPFRQVLVAGIGGSNLGIDFISDALWQKHPPCSLNFLNNTDPDGICRTLDRMPLGLDETLTIIISKSGGTIETKNGMEEMRYRYNLQGLDFSHHAVAITRPGSMLDKLATNEGWLASFPIWDWVGGRTSLFSPVGLIPLALQGIDTRAMLEGAAACDALTRCNVTRKNPAALMALMWYAHTGGKGGHQMVILPYKDRLEMLGRYLQQLVMESLGKEKDLDGNLVHQGLAVFGNKGSTDQHSYLQQLLEGPENSFTVFVEVLKDQNDPSPLITEESSSGDFLHALLLGTRKALSLKGRASLTVTIPDVTPAALGTLIALFERAVSIYALLVNVNAYDQPGVELGKTSASEIIGLKNSVLTVLRAESGHPFNVEELACKIESWQGKSQEVDRETLYHILRRLSANPECAVTEYKKNRDHQSVNPALRSIFIFTNKN